MVVATKLLEAARYATIVTLPPPAPHPDEQWQLGEEIWLKRPSASRRSKVSHMEEIDSMDVRR